MVINRKDLTYTLKLKQKEALLDVTQEVLANIHERLEYVEAEKSELTREQISEIKQEIAEVIIFLDSNKS